MTKEMLAKLLFWISNIPSKLFLPLVLFVIFFLIFLQAGLGGLSFDEGQFSVFGYISNTFRTYLSYVKIEKSTVYQLTTYC